MVYKKNIINYKVLVFHSMKLIILMIFLYYQNGLNYFSCSYIRSNNIVFVFRFNLCLIDLSYNILNDLCKTVQSLKNLTKLRILFLHGNPISVCSISFENENNDLFITYNLANSWLSYLCCRFSWIFNCSWWYNNYCRREISSKKLL